MEVQMMASPHKGSYRLSLLFLALTLLVVAPLAILAQQPSATPPANRNANADELIYAHVTVTDVRGRNITDLDRAAFTVIEDGQPREILYFTDSEVQLSVGIVFDASGSVNSRDAELLASSFQRFMEANNSATEYFLVGVSSRPSLLVDWTRDHNAVLSSMRGLQTRGNTSLYDACYLAIEKVRRHPRTKNVVLIFSDGGEDNNSRYRVEEVRSLLRQSGVLIYPVTLNSRLRPPTGASYDFFEESARISGGRQFFPHDAITLNDILQRLAAELRYQYVIGFRPASSTRSDQWHRFEVRVRLPSGRRAPQSRVRSRQGYFAISNTS
jgi:Ca-activated chloride channel homolog